MPNNNYQTATVPQQKGSQGRENPTQVSTLSKNPPKQR